MFWSKAPSCGRECKDARPVWSVWTSCACWSEADPGQSSCTLSAVRQNCYEIKLKIVLTVGTQAAGSCDSNFSVLRKPARQRGWSAPWWPLFVLQAREVLIARDFRRKMRERNKMYMKFTEFCNFTSRIIGLRFTPDILHWPLTSSLSNTKTGKRRSQPDL